MFRKLREYRLLFVLTVGMLFCASLCQAQVLQKEAVEYRNRGYTAQQSGDIETALVYYQKAVSLDPYYAVAYNDLGIIYEIKGYVDKAEAAYLKAVSINPNFAEAHSNLAFFYEARKKYDKAVAHWARRIELGNKDDFWTQKCWEKMWQYAPDKAKELEARLLAQEVAIQMEKDKEVRIVKAKRLYQEAMVFYNKRDYLQALPLFQEAYELLPNDPELSQMYQEVFAKTREMNICLHFEQAMTYYRQGNYALAKEEFEKILGLIPQQ
ncbi:MAG: tetratricopeptide repeat protein [Candidatus Omnitrophica bacterium]|nr:tetratricopeptide repeat protein [Candidatus Omnitrophota bacterium]